MKSSVVALSLPLAAGCFGQSLTPSESCYRKPLGAVVDAILKPVPLPVFIKLVGTDVDSMVAGTSWTPLCFAVAHGRQDIALWLLDQGADPNVKPGNQTTLINFAAENMSDAVFIALAKQGLDVNHPDASGVQPKHWAIFGNRNPTNASYPSFVMACLQSGIAFSPEERWEIIKRSANHLPTWHYHYEWLTKSEQEAHRRNDQRERRLGLNLIKALWNRGISEKPPGSAEVENKIWGTLAAGDHPVYRAARNGDMELLKLAIRFTPDWKARFRETGDKGWGLADDAYWCQNNHVVRFLLASGFPQPTLGRKARMEHEAQWKAR